MLFRVIFVSCVSAIFLVCVFICVLVGVLIRIRIRFWFLVLLRVLLLFVFDSFFCFFAAVKNDGVSVILAEELYGKDLGDTVSRETDVKMVYIDPLNRGDYDKDSYIDGMKKNFKLIEGAF